MPRHVGVRGLGLRREECEGGLGHNSVSGAWRELSSSRAWGQAPEEGVLPGWLAGSLQPGWGWGRMQGEAGRVWFGAPVGAP